jgi:hypothetical protein
MSTIQLHPPAQVWAFKNMGLYQPPEPNRPSYNSYQSAVDFAKMIQNSSHTPQGAFGYLLSQINPHPQLTFATHFPVADDMVECALSSIEAHNPGIQLCVAESQTVPARISPYQAPAHSSQNRGLCCLLFSLKFHT